ncbi:glycosyltransferase [Flavobacterium selenitireducens]|uniref:glycosyltransferase n=1 Tax=Flavobacterium selenitireducens TaxID=2722704 RepID=UPI00168ADC91|nr:glycosyltransferase [Flavobacterium selenitireducens]MBD3581275.1 glycosyltransferase family 1 protein [Flavobacterium selenitireducens]
MEKNTSTKQGDGAVMPKEEVEQQQYYDMVVFCHLRWQFVYQRPQHIISRFSKSMKILMVEEPVGFNNEDEATAIFTEVNPNLHILQPKVRDIEAIAEVLKDYVKNGSIPVGWFYSAAFSPLLSALKFDTVVYDCMDELALFKDAPQLIIDQEKYLLSNADIVFTGGKSLFESKREMHDNVYCFPSSVDEAHFATALNGIEIPADISNLPKPVVGYFGVIDERIDLEMIAETARKMPEVSFVMIGPLAKISQHDLPKEANIHYTGMKSYVELPNYLKGFDIAMMPFALNDATKFISPTKTLEYMAAGKAIISTRITDVLRDYSECVKFADDADEFSKHISNLLATQDQLSTISQYREILDNTSWDATVAKMQSIIKTFAS